MRSITKIALVGVLSLAVAGCGGSSEPASSADSAAPAADSAAPAAAAETPAAAVAGAEPAEFAMCKTCHSVQKDVNMVGPSLHGVYGAKAGAHAGYTYSEGFKTLGYSWDDEHLDKWLENPMKTVPGTKMAYAGIPDAAKRKAVIDYLKTLK
ncbi:c-type cytochrome [Novosphingobium sp. FSY-8]|uniref:C-type cytochrome n=1 Tax=Novosphingobium ovatum TaxID=1908523 RepID=A0ABW9XEV9_9SPHN|nr:c-type cytochrome [Novosphingobium ovatum]NBC37079.1 c-type cytochrome [Novosphingobium ovatum]